jgi:hypothetical protein
VLRRKREFLPPHNGSHEPVVSVTKHKNQSHFDRRLSQVSPARYNANRRGFPVFAREKGKPAAVSRAAHQPRLRRAAQPRAGANVVHSFVIRAIRG